MVRRLLAYLAMALVLVMALASFALCEDGAEAAPDFSLTGQDGKPLTLSSLRGSVVLVNFWATYCPDCIAEMPKLDELNTAMKAKGLRVIAISNDRSERYLKKYLEKNPIGLTVLFDEGQTVTRHYRVFSTPTSFLIDKRGMIVEKFYGQQDWTGKVITQKIEGLLKD